MRTKALILAAAVAAAGIASVQAQSNVYSVNVVGYVNKVFTATPPLTLIAPPLNTPTNTIFGLFGGVGGALPEGTVVFLWTGTAFAQLTRDDFSQNGWAPDGVDSTPLAPGTGAFIKNVSGVNITNTFVGEVLTGNLTNTLTGLAGRRLVGSKVPQAGQVDTALGLPIDDGDSVYLWVGTQYATFTADAFSTPAPWGNYGAPPSVGVAEGFFVSKLAPANWVRNFTIP